jgi:hypothetical protein
MSLLKVYVSSQVTFVAKNGDRYPPSPSPGILIPGPFKNDAKKPPSFDMELPPGFDVAGIIVYNPKDDQIPRRVLAWLADRLNIKIPFFNGNVLNFLTRKTNLQGLTNGDVSVNPGGPFLRSFTILCIIFENSSCVTVFVLGLVMSG